MAGQTRRLKHIVTRAAVFSDKRTIDESVIEFVAGKGAASVPGAGARETSSDYSSFDYRTARERFEQDYFRAILDRHGGNITASAASIGMAQSNLSRKLKDLGLR